MKKASLLCLFVVLFVVSCTDETIIYSDPQKDLGLEEDEEVLINSVVYDNAGVLDILEEDNISGKYASSAKVKLAGDYPLTLVAQVDPPSYSGGENLTATHVHIDGNYAYVSYNTVGEDYAGAIDIINVSDPTEPTSYLTFVLYQGADINSLLNTTMGIRICRRGA